MKKITLLFTLMLSLTIFAQNDNGSIDAAGDIIIIAYDTTNDDGLSFILLDDAPDGTSIRFIDAEWTGSGFNSVEGEVLWTNNTGSTIASGEVISIENIKEGATISVVGSKGTASEDVEGYTHNSTDQVTAVTGTSSVPGVILTSYGDELSANASEVHTFAGTGLTNGEDALATADPEGVYTGTTNFAGFTSSDMALALTDPDNWTFGTFTFPDDVPTFSFTTLSNELLDVAKSSIFSNGSGFESTDASLTIEVYNTLGQKVTNSGLAAGIYILKVTNAQGELVTVKKAI